MRNTREMLNTHPKAGSLSDAVANCLEACMDCAAVCTVCADACLAEDMVADLRQCIRTDLDCADVCMTSARLLSRRTGSNEAVVRAQVEAMRLAVRACADECEQHADMHEHCRICAEACRRCETACDALLGDLATA